MDLAQFAQYLPSRHAKLLRAASSRPHEIRRRLLEHQRSNVTTEPGFTEVSNGKDEKKPTYCYAGFLMVRVVRKATGMR